MNLCWKTLWHCESGLHDAIKIWLFEAEQYSAHVAADRKQNLEFILQHFEMDRDLDWWSSQSQFL